MLERRAVPTSHMPLTMVARPARLSLLVDAEVKGLHWLRMFENALASQSRFWGGQGNLILPLTKDFTDQEIFWGLMDLYDPDAFLTYAPTWEELKDIAPRIYDEQVTSWQEAISRQANDSVAQEFIESAQTEAAIHPSAEKGQIRLIEARLSPLSDPGPAERALDWFNGTNPAGWPLTDLSEFEELPEAIAVPVAHAGAARQLLLTALKGRIQPSFAKTLAERNVQLIEKPVSKYEWIEVIRERISYSGSAYPWEVSMTGLATFRTGGFIRTPATLVVGDSPWDFALFYALLRLTGRAWWLPSWLARDEIYQMAIRSAIEWEPRNEAREAVVVSVSSPTARDRVARKLNDLHSVGLDVAHWRDVLPDEPSRILSRDTAGRVRLIPIVEDEVLELDTPIPTQARTRVPAEMRWISEVRASNWEPIRNSQLGPRLLPGADIVRTSRNGLAYFSTSSFIFAGASLDSVVVRPSLIRLPLGGQVEWLLKQQGWSAEVSDKAIYARESMKLFGGFDALCNGLRDKSVRAVIDSYRGEPQIGPRLSHDHRRYLTYAHFEQLLGDDARSVIDPLLDKGVLTRGMVLRCGRCRQAAWHSSETVAGSFTCSRCGVSQGVDRDTWFGTAEPVLSYRMAEVLFQLLEQNGDLPLLAARDAFGESPRPIGRGYELSINAPDGRSQEVDIFQSDGYRLWIGEASRSAEFDDSRLRFLAELADVLSAYGVLLATSRANWRSNTDGRARTVFPGPWPQLRLLSGVRTKPEAAGLTAP